MATKKYSLYMGLVWSDQAPSRLNQNSFCITKATNSQHGRVRWYLVHIPNGKERETCEKVRRIIPHNLMQVVAR